MLPRLQLEGPANDVVLMKSTLTNAFAVPPEHVVVLSEADGKTKADLLPTRANIVREFKRLAEVTQADDEVIILLGGHGSQQPENPNRKEPKIDGQDEIFLPRDVCKWNDTAGTVANAIVCSELGEWLSAIQEKGAFVWLVIDACHSGTMMSGIEARAGCQKMLTAPQGNLSPSAILGQDIGSTSSGGSGGFGGGGGGAFPPPPPSPATPGDAVAPLG